MKRQLVGKVCALAAVAGVWNVGVSRAEIVGGGGSSSLGGSFQLLTQPPASVGPDAFQSPDLLAFDESQDVLLNTAFALSPGLVLPAGSVLSSHYVAFDPATGATVNGFVDFDQPIVAVLRTPATLDASTALFGLGATSYATAPAVGPEPPGSNPNNPDAVFVSPDDPRRLLFASAANSPGDQVRVLTGVLVPEPSQATLLALAVLTAVGSRVGYRRAR